MGISKHRGKHPKWMVYNNGKPYEQMDDLGGKPTIFGNTHIVKGSMASGDRHSQKVD